MNKIILTISCLFCVTSLTFSQQKPILNGVWEWDAVAMQGKPVIAKFITISDQNGTTNNGKSKITMTPDDVKNTYSNWIAGTNIPADIFYTTFGNYYYSTVGGYRNRNAKGEIIATGEYIVSFTRLPNTPNHIITGALILRSWNKPIGNIQNRGGESIVLVGQWINKALQQANITTTSSVVITPDLLKKAFISEGIAVKKPLEVDLPPAKLTWKPTYSITDIEFETLTVDSEKDAIEKNNTIVPYYKNKAEYRGSFNMGTFVSVNGNNINRWNAGTIFDYAYNKSPRLLVIGLNEIVDSKENYSKAFGVAQNEFNITRIRLFGTLAEIDGPFESGSDMSTDSYRKMENPTQLLYTNPSIFKEVFLKDLVFGDNKIDISKDGKTFRLHFTIN